MAQELSQSITELLGGTLPPELIIFIISLLPVLELRGGLIAASLLGVEFVKAFIICFAGNMLPIPFIILFIRKFLEFLAKFPVFSPLVDKIINKSEKNKEKILRYEKWGLLIFVAIPLPGTGAWSGALVAGLLNMRMRSALPIISLGVLIAGGIISVISYLIPALI
ncbi:MAG: small multi-drug export protein [Anaerofustis stercorihominis]|nr:small multi-drug export protein [Anaerofustis stercorihominis]